MSSPQNQTVFYSRGEGDNRSQIRINDNSSRMLSHHSERSRRSMPFIIANEPLRNVTACNFFLCFCSIILFTSGLLLIGVSLWVLLTRIPYLYLINHASYFGVTSFTISAGMLCFPTGWLACATQSRRRSSTIPLLILLICLSTILLGTGTCIGITYQSQASFDWVHENTIYQPNYYNFQTNNPKIYNFHAYSAQKKGHPVLQAGSFRSALNGSMIESQHMYDSKASYRIVWDAIQSRLYCCGVNGPKDWLKVRAQIPTTCCDPRKTERVYCTEDTMYKYGCLDVVAFDLSWQISLLTGIGIVVLFMKLMTLIIASYVCLKMCPNHSTFSSQVFYHHRTPSNQSCDRVTFASGTSHVASATAPPPPPSYYYRVYNSGETSASTFPTLPVETNLNNQPLSVSN